MEQAGIEISPTTMAALVFAAAVGSLAPDPYYPWSLASLSDRVRADSDGQAVITLNITSEVLAGDTDSNRARRRARNRRYGPEAPAAKSVAVFDADNKMLEISTRK